MFNVKLLPPFLRLPWQLFCSIQETETAVRRKDGLEADTLNSDLLWATAAAHIQNCSTVNTDTPWTCEMTDTELNVQIICRSVTYANA